MTLRAELAAALPRGVHVEVYGRAVFVTSRHVRGGIHTIPAVAGSVDDVIVAVARELRHAVERWGPIVATLPGEA